MIFPQGSNFRAAVLALLLLAMGPAAAAEGLFGDREIHLSDPGNAAFSVGVTGTTAGFNYIALVENARQESVPLGRLGYWEKISDPPAFLRNPDLLLVFENRQPGRFKLAFSYDPDRRDIDFRVDEGAVTVAVDRSGYAPLLIVRANAAPAPPPAVPAPGEAARQVFFDFNSFDSELRRYYGRIQRLLQEPQTAPQFYCYEAAGHDGYYFRTYRDTARLDAQKMGLSLENGTLTYYQGILDNLKSRFGKDFARELVLVTRFGKPHGPQLVQYARDIGLSGKMKITFQAYEDLP